MTDKCYKVEFVAHLHKLTLALKMQCEIQVIWKRGQKKCESGKFKLIKGQALFDKIMTIECNMIFNPATKIFKQKITKFAIILISEKGTKQAGEVEFDVAEYINSRQLEKNDYTVRLSGCPDKNAKLSYSLTGNLKQQISMDAISQSSYLNTENCMTNTTNILESKNNNKNKKQDKRCQQVCEMEQQNRKISQKLKQMQKLKKSNEQLKKKIKNEQYQRSQQLKKKIQKYKNQIQNMKSQIRRDKKIQSQTNTIQKELLACKIKIMRAFNFAAQYGGSELVDSIQAYCGYEQK